MNFLSVENLTKSYGDKLLFENISFGISQGQRVAMVARNGAGKSTLLRILSGKENADSGSVTFRKDIRVAFLEQEPSFGDAETIHHALFRADNPVMRAVRDYEIAAGHHAENPSPASQLALEQTMAEVERLHAWNHEVKVKQILSRLNIHHLGQPLNSLSGGELKRVALARVLIEDPQMLIMDEPTNHLDLDMIEWLENYFTRNNLTLLVVTHDRYFLDSVCSDIVEIDNGTLYHYNGNYEYFIHKKAEREFNEARELDKARNLFLRELEWVRKMPRARGTKSKSRVDAFYNLQETLSGKRREDELQLNVKMSRVGGKILELKKVYKSFGDKVLLKGFDYTFKRGERIGIVGKNGSGKTTFLNIITGQEQPDSGKVNVGDTIVYGYYSQKGLQLKEDKRVIEVVKDIADFIPLADGTKMQASQFLKLFQFPPEMQYTYVSRLSGGEKKRLYLLTVLMKNPNFLILDEPTNDLDLITLSTLEQFLADFSGCLIIVSHDRYFMDKLADHLLILEGDGKVRGFLGSYTEYRETLKEAEREQKQEQRREAEQLKNPGPAKTRLTNKERYEFQGLEKEIPLLEKQKEELTLKLNGVSSDHQELMKISEELGRISALLDEKTMRWLELSEKGN